MSTVRLDLNGLMDFYNLNGLSDGKVASLTKKGYGSEEHFL